MSLIELKPITALVDCPEYLLEKSGTVGQTSFKQTSHERDRSVVVVDYCTPLSGNLGNSLAGTVDCSRYC